ncbi:hypothetical protein MIR68_011237 [Amoeboaphelidium protococcarum]|nr:hypothetical protein MIR68_011237 [Amoeboaphelidium protococcarum]
MINANEQKIMSTAMHQVEIKVDQKLLEEREKRSKLAHAFRQKYDMEAVGRFIHPGQLVKAPFNKSAAEIAKSVQNQHRTDNLDAQVLKMTGVDLALERDRFQKEAGHKCFKYYLHELELLPFLEGIGKGDLLLGSVSFQGGARQQSSSTHVETPRALFEASLTKVPSPVKPMSLIIGEKEQAFDDFVDVVSARILVMNLIKSPEPEKVVDLSLSGDLMVDKFDGQRFANQIKQHSATLETVRFSGHSLSVEFVLEIQASLEQCQSLTAVDLSDCFVGKKSSLMQIAGILSAVARHTYLRVLDLSQNALSAAVIELVVSVLSLSTSIKELKLGNCGLNEDAFELLLSAAPEIKSNLAVMDLSRNRFGKFNVSFLNQFVAKMSNLQWLSLSGCCLEAPQTIAMMSALQFCSQLQYLSFQDCSMLKMEGEDFISDGSEILCKSIPFWRRLKFLDVSSTLICGLFAEDLAKALVKLDSLKEIDVSYNEELGHEFSSILLQSEGWLRNVSSIKAIECGFVDDENVVNYRVSRGISDQKNSVNSFKTMKVAYTKQQFSVWKIFNPILTSMNRAPFKTYP